MERMTRLPERLQGVPIDEERLIYADWRAVQRSDDQEGQRWYSATEIAHRVAHHRGGTPERVREQFFYLLDTVPYVLGPAERKGLVENHHGTKMEPRYRVLYPEN